VILHIPFSEVSRDITLNSLHSGPSGIRLSHFELVMPSPEKSSSRRKKSSFFRGHLPFEHETALFLLVSVFDVLMTYLMLRSGRFYEANPVARFFINHWGPQGMVYFKFSVVAFICVLTQIIATRKPLLAERVLQFATVIVSCVVVYSLVLFVRHTGGPEL
jgi:hypothetical protein